MEVKTNNSKLEAMFKAGAHFGYAKSRRHPTVAPYIFGVKNKVEIFDLEKTNAVLQKTLDFVKSLGKESKTIILVGGKNEAREAVRSTALMLGLPYVDGRWIGGTITNFPEIKRRVEKFEKLTAEKEKGELVKYTKKERLLIDREISNLEAMFGGIVSLKELPKAIFVVDPKREKNAVKEANDKNIPVIALLGSDCDMDDVDYPMVGNDSSRSSIQYFLNAFKDAYSEGKKEGMSSPATASSITAKK